MLEKLDMVQCLVFGVSDPVYEIFYGRGGVSAAAESAQRRHAGIVPSVHQPLLDELKQFTLAHHGICEV